MSADLDVLRLLNVPGQSLHDEVERAIAEIEELRRTLAAADSVLKRVLDLTVEALDEVERLRARINASLPAAE